MSGGARLRFDNGHAVLTQRDEVPPGAAAARFSVISPGTELRHMQATVNGPARDAGYMNITRHPLNNALLLAPVPHGSWIDPEHPRALIADAQYVVEAAAVARFQLIAAIGMRRLPLLPPPNEPLVIGSGPVALGCCLELTRRGAKGVRVWTRRTRPPFANLEGIEVTHRVPSSSARLVIDATGDLDRAVQVAARNGTIGVLGTPPPGQKVAVDRIHRQGLIMIGMHELAGYDHADYQRTFSRVLCWARANLANDLLGSWCLRLAAAQAESLYECLNSPGERPDQPVILLEWGR
ncbi:hypothetical protein ACWDUL_20365 [Nocardia niigatensis]